MEVHDELADLKRSRKVAQCDGVGREAGELLDQTDQGLEVFLDGDVEGVFKLEVDGDCRMC